ncbi:transcriptional regulator [Bradyrhizobium sp. Y36]|uniref:MarR family winged helix-turn-helix transcriptional regulator n=1 Tax=Bradyrhizobium sp. Y36 TaxID=2035447 RepID=UPI000BE7F3BC|nr:MarR family transcriptional regulator [Bradyrhizobium sp. Y36]PDT90652.1 transcriptional regulator [Bradyrhizobium sp. Y36]
MTGRSGESRGREATARGTAQDDGELDLQRYFPYRLARLAEQVSLAVAEVYSERFALTRQEWRVLAILGARAEIATKEIGPLTTLDKMQVSRAVQGLQSRGIASRKHHPDDRRELIVSLTPAGRALYRKIVPFALARETELLGALTAEEVKVLDRVMHKLSAALS